jgi:cytoskeletal protein RodZ
MEWMRLALFCFLLAALSWPALAQQDQSQTPAPQNPPQSQAPVQPSTPAGSQQAPATEAPPSSATRKKKTVNKKSDRKKSQKKRKKAARTKPPDATADEGPRRVVVRRGSTSETGGQLEPGVASSETAHQRQITQQLLQSASANVKNISGRKLTPDQQDMVRQITFYMEQSRSADKEGDLVRARNLAVKAHMLSDELARQ